MSVLGGGARSSFDILRKMDPQAQITSNTAAKTKINETNKPSKRSRQTMEYELFWGISKKLIKTILNS